MAFDLPEHWVWDFWVVDDGSAYHLFFLKAPRTLGDPDLRHQHASVGHAVSADLVAWNTLPDALVPQPAPAFDDLATWTGCVVRDDDGLWWMFTTGIARAEQGQVQRVGAATSTDLITWQRRPEVWEADPQWYATSAGAHWRDPWLVRDDVGTWHVYVTAAVGGPGSPGSNGGTGVVGHATTTDLTTWDLGPPLSTAPSPFEQLEVISLGEVEGRWVLLFSCLASHMPGAAPGAGGVWSVPVEGPGAPVDVAAAVRLTSEQLYVGKLVTLRGGTSCFLAFVNHGADERFVGGITDPSQVTWRADGAGLRLVDVSEGWLPGGGCSGEGDQPLG